MWDVIAPGVEDVGSTEARIPYFTLLGKEAKVIREKGGGGLRIGWRIIGGHDTVLYPFWGRRLTWYGP